MSFRSTARAAGALRDPSLVVPKVDEGSVSFVIDAGQDPVHVPLHDLGKAGKRKCVASDSKPCPLCDAGVPVRHNWTATVNKIDENGELSPRTLWLDRRDLERIASQLPDSGTVEMTLCRVIDAAAEKEGRKRRDGSPWTVYSFAVTDNSEVDCEPSNEQ